MYSLKVKNASGDELILSHSNKYIVYNVEGLTPPQAKINLSVNSTQDGSIVNSSQVESRNIVIYMAIESPVEANRINLYKYFTPKSRVTLYFSNGSRDVYIEGTVELIECSLFSQRETAQISIICEKPYFKGVESFVSSFSDISKLFEFPVSFPEIGLELSSINPNIRKTILYTGDVESGIIIQLFANGTVVNPTIYNVFEKTKFKLNITLEESDTILINTNVGDKSVSLIKDGVTTNALGYMDPSSTWFSLSAGDNVFTYECESGSSNLDITFTTSLLYGGV